MQPEVPDTRSALKAERCEILPLYWLPDSVKLPRCCHRPLTSSYIKKGIFAGGFGPDGVMASARVASDRTCKGWSAISVRSISTAPNVAMRADFPWKIALISPGIGVPGG